MIEHTSEDRPRFPRDSHAATPRSPGHYEWLIDQSIAETFPASDATSPVRPGSIVASYYSTRKHDLASALGARGVPFVCAAIGLSLLCALVLLGRRG
jgi:hypothetical protein